MTVVSIRSAIARRCSTPYRKFYNHYVIHTPITFDLEPYTVERRATWFEQFAVTGRHRLLVAEEDGMIMGYAGTMRFRVKPAYDSTVETTALCRAGNNGEGESAESYMLHLFEALAGENIHRIVAGYTLPNPGSAKLHEQFGFKHVGVFSEVGYKVRKILGRSLDGASAAPAVNRVASGAQQLARDGAVQIHCFMELLFRNVFAVGVGYVNRPRPQQHRRSPVGQRGDIGGEFSHHAFHAIDGAQLHKRNIQDKLGFCQTFNRLGYVLPQSVGRPQHDAIQQLCAGMIAIRN